MRTAISHHAFQQRKVGQYWHFTAWVWNVSKQADLFVSRRSTESERASAIANFTSQHGTVKTWPWKSNSFHSLSKFLFCFWAFQVWPKDLIEREKERDIIRATDPESYPLGQPKMCVLDLVTFLHVVQ